MSMEIQWTASRDLSALHAAWCLQTFPERSKHLSEDLKSASVPLLKVSKTFSAMTPNVPLDRFWEVFFATCADSPRSRDLVERTVAKLCGSLSESLQAEFLASVQGMKAAFDRAFPKFTDQAPLRVAPLREIWDAHGPGLLRLVANLTDESFMVGAARVFFVQPILGGWGFAHLPTNSVQFEAVMTNESPEFPESLRLTWLLSQLDFERPVLSEQIHRFQLRRIAGFAMIPPVLRAGEEIGLCRFTVDSVQRAIGLWQSDLSNATPALAEVLMTWWDTYQTSRPAWPTALTALDRMVG